MFRSKLDTNQHSKWHTADAHMCWLCGKVFTTCPHFDTYVRRNPGWKSQLYNKGALTKHSRMPANDRRHQCSVCNKRFFTQSTLNLHSIIITGNSPHTCATYQKSFTDRGYCMWHLMIQCGEKCFVCRSVGRHSLGKWAWKDMWDCTLVRNIFTVTVVVSFALKLDLNRHTERLHAVKE
jgi:hypothetical protein